jgi:TolA-binding protein
MKNKKHTFFTVLALGLQIASFSQIKKNPADDLLVQSRLLIEQKDYDKAKLSLNLHNKYVENEPKKWLAGQHLLIQIALDNNNLTEVQALLKESDDIIASNKLNQAKQAREIALQKADFYLLQNRFIESNKTLGKLISEFSSHRAQEKLINNKIDEALILKLKGESPKQNTLDKLVAEYETNPRRNPLELIRLKNKLAVVFNNDKSELDSFLKLQNYWIQKDEFLILKIHLLNEAGKAIEAYKAWQSEKAILSLKSHPATIHILSNLIDTTSIQQGNETQQLLDFSRTLVRNNTDLDRLTQSELKWLIKQKKIPEALATIESYLTKFPKAQNKDKLRLSICEALIIKEDFKQAMKIFQLIDKTKLSSGLWRNRAHFTEATLLQNSGQQKEAAALFLRVGQTAKDKELSINSLFKAAQLFSQIENHKSAVLAYTLLISKPRHLYTDKSYSELYRALEKQLKYKDALSIINDFIIKGEDPTLKENALYDKGHILLKSGDLQNAIKTFQDFAVIYPKKSRSAALLFEVYNIQKRKLKDFKKATTTLDTIIAKAKDTAPDTYSLALHHRALLYQIDNLPRKSIELWQTCLDFNQKRNFYLIDEIKLQLAAVYQNSNELDSSAAANIYADIITHTTTTHITELALANLHHLKDSAEATEKATIQLLNKKGPLSVKTLELIVNWIMKQDLNKNKALLIRLHKQLQRALELQTKIDPYWQAKGSLLEAALSEDKEKRTEILKKALSEVSASQLSSIEKKLLTVEIYLSLGASEEALATYIDLIYEYQYKIANDNYIDWRPYHLSCTRAAQLLKAQKRVKEINALKQRITKAALPGYQETLVAIDQILKGEVK